MLAGLIVGGIVGAVGSQASFQLAVLGEMRRRAMELIEHGGVRLADQDLAQLAANVGLASGLVARVIARWMQDGNDGPAFLARVDGEADRFTLGDAYASALELLREGGHREKKGAASGRRAARGRKARWGIAPRSSSPLATGVAPPLLPPVAPPLPAGCDLQFSRTWVIHPERITSTERNGV